MPTGKVAWFNTQKGFGFIERDDAAKDIFVHWTEVEENERGLKSLNGGQKVTFDVEESPKGLLAVRVKKIK